MRLHQRGGRVCDLVSRQLQQRPQDDQAGDQDQHPDESIERLAGEHPRHRLAGERQPPHGNGNGGQADERGQGHAAAHTARHAEESSIEVHVVSLSPSYRTGVEKGEVNPGWVECNPARVSKQSGAKLAPTSATHATHRSR